MKCHDGILFEYDMNGNLIRKTDPAEGQTGYVFNYANRLFKTVFPDNTESVNNYASSGLRSMSRDKTGNTAHYYWDGLNIESIPNAISESDVEGNITNTYLPGIGFRHINNNNNWRWFITDHLGSIIALTDNAGNVCDIYEYDEYGIQTTSKGSSFTPYRYIGQQFDKAEGLLYLRARYYDSQTGRFVSRDPIGIAGGMNWYGYSKNNPIAYLDADGNSPSVVVVCFVTAAHIIRCAYKVSDYVFSLDEKTINSTCCGINKKYKKKWFDKVKHCAGSCELQRCLPLVAGVQTTNATLLAGVIWEFTQAGIKWGPGEWADLLADTYGLAAAPFVLKNCLNKCCEFCYISEG